MSLNEHIKRPFLTTAIAVLLAFVVISSTFSIKNAYAEGSNAYRPSYSWAERPQRNVTTVEFARNTLRTWVKPYAPVEDGYRSAVGGVMRGYGYLLERYAPEVFSPGSMDNYIKEIDIMPTREDWRGDITSAIPVVGTIQNWTTKSKWMFQDVPNFHAQTMVSPGTINISPQTIHTPRFEPPQMVNFSEYQNVTNRIAQSSIVSNPVAYDNYMHSLQTRVTRNLESIAQNSIVSNPVAYDNYMQHYNPPDTQFNNLPSQSTVYRDHFFYNDVGRSFRQQHLNSLDNWSNINPVVRGILQNRESFKVPDFSKYQNMANQMNSQFNNLPSPSTVYRDHFFHNDIGRSFRQQPIYQLPSVVDLGTLRISAPTIHTPRFEPSQIPRYEPIYIPQVPIPVYQPPAMPNF